ncbi:MAG: CRISPR-associated protein Cas4 [bacterium]|nr:CRISPR-associated protein Cas4 [bacterium]
MDIFKDYLKEDLDFYSNNEEIRIMGVLVWYYYVCHRQVWFISRNINSDQEDPYLEVGRTIHEIFYTNEKKEFIFENIKIDIIRLSEENTVIIGEIKKSSKFIKPAIMQVAFYLYTLKNIIPTLTANLLIPLEKKNIKVELTPELEKELKECIDSITNIIKNEKPPKFKKIVFCEKCAYRFYCFS